MLAKNSNLFATSPQTNPYVAVAGQGAGSLRNTRPLSFINGHSDGMGANVLILPGNWVKTLGSGTVTLSDGHPASIAIVTDTTQDAVTSLELSKDGGTTVWKPFLISATDVIVYRGWVKTSDVANSAFLFGISNTAVANIFGTGGSRGAIGAGITDFVGFHHASGGTALSGVVRKASTSTSQTLSGVTLLDDTYVSLAIRVTSAAVEFWVNSQIIYTQTTVTNLPLTSTNLTPRLSAQTAAAAAKTVNLTRPFWMQEVA